jgi:hypothetical protein
MNFLLKFLLLFSFILIESCKFLLQKTKFFFKFRVFPIKLLLNFFQSFSFLLKLLFPHILLCLCSLYICLVFFHYFLSYIYYKWFFIENKRNTYIIFIRKNDFFHQTYFAFLQFSFVKIQSIKNNNFIFYKSLPINNLMLSPC